MQDTETQTPTRYEMGWHNRWLTDDATSIEEMAETLEGRAAYLRRMAAAGVRLDEDSPMADDYAILFTENKAVAKRFGFEECPSDEDEYLCEDCRRAAEAQP